MFSLASQMYFLEKNRTNIFQMTMFLVLSASIHYAIYVSGENSDICRILDCN